MSDGVWVIDLPVSLVVDETMLGASVSGALAGQPIEMLWPADAGNGELMPPPCSMALPADLVWGSPSERGSHTVDRVVLSASGVTDHGNFCGRLAEFRSALMLWIGVLTGQPSTARWGERRSQRNTEGIQYAVPDDDGTVGLHPFPTRSISIVREGAGISVLQLDQEIFHEAWNWAVVNEEPPFEVALFQSAREAFQRREERVAVLELGSALEVLFWPEYEERAKAKGTKMKKKNSTTLGSLVRSLAEEFHVFDNSDDSPSKKFVELRNDLVHRADEGFYHGPCVEAFGFALEQFQRRHPDLYRFIPAE